MKFLSETRNNKNFPTRNTSKKGRQVQKNFAKVSRLTFFCFQNIWLLEDVALFLPYLFLLEPLLKVGLISNNKLQYNTCDDILFYNTKRVNNLR